MFRPIVIAGSRGQFHDWCAVSRTNPRAAVYVATEDELRAALLDSKLIVLWGDYTLNPAYLAWLRHNRKAA